MYVYIYNHRYIIIYIIIYYIYTHSSKVFLSEHVRPICFFTWGTRVLFNVSINIAQVYLGNTILKKQGRVSRVWIKTQVPCSEIIKIVSTCHIFWTSFFSQLQIDEAKIHRHCKINKAKQCRSQPSGRNARCNST